MKGINTFKGLRIFQLMLLMIIFFTLTGCWSANEINNISTINLIGIDKNDYGEVEVTVVISKPHTLFAETVVSGNNQSKFVIETITGNSIFDAMGELSSSISERIFFEHVDVIVFGERAASEIMASSLDYFKRGTDFRPNIQLLVTEGSASRLVKTLPQLNLTLGLELQDLILSNRFADTAMVKDLSQFIKDMSSNTVDPITGVVSDAEAKGIKIDEKGDRPNNQSDVNKKESENNQKKTPKVLSLKGTAVFKGDQLQGFLNDRETRGLLWVKGELQNEIIVLTCGGSNEENISLQVTKSKSKITPQIEGKTKRMRVNIQVEADIGQITCQNFNVNSESIEQLNQQLESVVRQDVNNVLEKVKNQWQADPFGFGQVIYRKHPSEWKGMASNWRSGLLHDLKVDLNVSANISRFGLIKDPMKVNEEE